MCALCVSGAVNTQGLCGRFYVPYLNFHPFIHFIEEEKINNNKRNKLWSALTPLSAATYMHSVQSRCQTTRLQGFCSVKTPLGLIRARLQV